jgi:hypothetical protein
MCGIFLHVLQDFQLTLSHIPDYETIFFSPASAQHIPVRIFSTGI